MLARDTSLVRAQACEHEANESAASIAAIPDEQLPGVEARAALIALAMRGVKVCAYTPVGSPTYVLWLPDPNHPELDGR